MSLSRAVEKNDLEAVQTCLNSDTTSAIECNEAFQEAASKGHLEIVAFLLKDTRVIPGDFSTEAMDSGRSDITKTYNYALQLAIMSGHIQIVSYLLKDNRITPINPHHPNDSLLQLAVMYNKKDIVKCLLADERVDPSQNNFAAVRESIRRGFIEIAQEILSVMRNKQKALYTFIPVLYSEAERTLAKRMLSQDAFTKFGTFFHPENKFIGLNKDLIEVVSQKYIEVELSPLGNTTNKI